MQIILFSLTFLISALLVFSVQPMIGKMMLPFVGGSPAGWVVAMAFFQIALLGGYTLAWLGARLNVFTQSVMIFALLGVGCVSLPIVFQSQFLQGGITPLSVFVQLGFIVGLPFMALSSIAPGLQRIFSYSGHKTAGDPYYLYAASNVGSFAGLLAYPLAVEPLVSLDQQSKLWAAGYAGLLALLLVCCGSVFLNNRSLIKLGFEKVQVAVSAAIEPAPRWKMRLHWIVLAAVPSSLVLGVTTEITTDIASLPMLWVIPLALYLVTHILAFGKSKFARSESLPYFHLFLVAVVLFTKIMLQKSVMDFSMFAVILSSYLLCFFITCLLLHAALVRLRPPVQFLTEFYFYLALGGAIGGSFNAFAAPVLFENQYEFMGVLVASILLNPLFRWPEGLKNWVKALLAGGVFALLAGLSHFVSADGGDEGLIALVLIGAGVFAGLCISIVRPVYLAAGAIAIFVMLSVVIPAQQNLVSVRNFFGVSIVQDKIARDENWDKEYPIREYYHGSTLHGFQCKDAECSTYPLAYYGLGTALDSAFAVSDPKDVMVVGLGVGTMACFNKLYRRAEISFVEIDDAVEDIAINQFSYLQQCGYKNITIDDGRLYFGRPENLQHKFDMIIIDAFSSDVVPLHLLTLEAIEVYENALNEGGVIVMNVSNRYFDLVPPLARVGTELGLSVFAHQNLNITDDILLYESTWVVMTADDKNAAEFKKAGWALPQSNGALWSDNFSNLIGAAKPFSAADREVLIDASMQTQVEMHGYVLKKRALTEYDRMFMERYIILYERQKQAFAAEAAEEAADAR